MIKKIKNEINPNSYINFGKYNMVEEYGLLSKIELVEFYIYDIGIDINM